MRHCLFTLLKNSGLEEPRSRSRLLGSLISHSFYCLFLHFSRTQTTYYTTFFEDNTLRQMEILKESPRQPELCGSLEGLSGRIGLRDSGVMGFQSLFLWFVRGQMNGCTPALVCWANMTEDLKVDHAPLKVLAKRGSLIEWTCTMSYCLICCFLFHLGND